MARKGWQLSGPDDASGRRPRHGDIQRPRRDTRPRRHRDGHTHDSELRLHLHQRPRAHRLGRPGRPPPGAAGAFQAIDGLVALFRDEVYLVRSDGLVVNVDFTVWGWVHLILGLVLV